MPSVTSVNQCPCCESSSGASSSSSSGGSSGSSSSGGNVVGGCHGQGANCPANVVVRISGIAAEIDDGDGNMIPNPYAFFNGDHTLAYRTSGNPCGFSSPEMNTWVKEWCNNLNGAKLALHCDISGPPNTFRLMYGENELGANYDEYVAEIQTNFRCPVTGAMTLINSGLGAASISIIAVSN